MIDLSTQTALAYGGHQVIFRHPDFDDRVIKVARKRIPRSWHFGRNKSRYGPLRDWHRTTNEYISMLSKTGAHCPRIPRQYGFEETSMGPAMICELFSGPGNTLAPTLGDMICQSHTDIGFLDEIRDDLTAMFDDLIAAGIEFEDLNPRNIVVTQNAQRVRLVIVDGLGSPALFPLTTFGARIFKKVMTKRRDTLVGQVNMAINKLEDQQELIAINT
ncbi:PhoP regulatory network protein YrbL [Yoonia tamlensis]|uniref:PhoP regulatory network protein YrbL n=1 Tax=Yoonia tamlensis TaxID=390270 RepID=A0A1I6HYJ4_9RHOB|nr:YrbL family protein [Yoonia tamlensis]SFR59507.1 PhoP regulatory network protein YrbL [Yoonia tamlensis]